MKNDPGGDYFSSSSPYPTKNPAAAGFLFALMPLTYIQAIMASPKAEHFTSVAPSIKRAKS